MNPWSSLHYHGQQWQQPPIAPPQRPPPAFPPQRHPPPAPPQRPQPTQQVPPVAHPQRIVYPPPAPAPIIPSSHHLPSHMAAEPPRIDLTPFREFASAVGIAMQDQEARLTAKINGIETTMKEQQARTSATLNGIEIVMGALSKNTNEVLEMAKAALHEAKNSTGHTTGPTRQEMKDAFTALHNFITQTTRAVLGKTERLEGMLGDPSAPDYDDSKRTVFGRIDRMEQALLELSETVSDPEAARPVIVRHEAAVNTSPPPRMTTDVGVDALAPPSPLQLPQSLLQVSEIGVQAEGPLLVDAEVETTTEVPRRFSTESGTAFAPSPTAARAAPFFPKTFDVQTLAPAQWTPREEDSESSDSEPSCRSPQDHPHHSQKADFYDQISAAPRFASSIFDEQEIDHTLGDGTDDATRCGLSTPASPHRALPKSPVAAILIPLPFRNSKSPPLAPPVPTIAPPTLPANSSPLQAPTIPSTPLSLKPVNSAPSAAQASSVLVGRALSPSAASSSSLSSVPTSSPPLPPQGTEQPQQAPPLERTISYSSMSSLSTISSNDSQPVPNPAASASASAPVKVKTERAENGTVGRPAKRRKTAASALGLQCKAEKVRGGASSSARNGRGGSSARGGRGRGRGGGQGGRRKSQQLRIMPIKEPAAAAVPQEPRQRYEAPRIGTDCPWPGKISGHDHREFVACDFCQGWYHFGCVGLTKGDPRLDPDAEFVCPPCESSSEIREQRRSVRFQEAACLRPDCDHPGAAEDTNEYFVERIIGRRPYRATVDLDVTQPTKFMWLVKWDGWKADQATWAANEHLGECSRIIEEFELAAEIEGRNLVDPDATVLLNEAAAAGWGAVRF
ncbi:hypothetical protein K466DRAFT_585009 [Polyporus arcularius HHB13444]|uniref:Chromo domain-containing protein n=1 Tax=Polyporus arcularius HHB13444 TaxID=1314778 RepID=A0A5C3PHJ6_9APHY|nr:hypothetical protein K466DRAFT_585009 [Polyporus arcularius HHB13444]